MEIWQWLGDLHPKLVQFPLVLLLVGLLFDLGGLSQRTAQRRLRSHWAGMAITALGTLGLLFAFICGIYAEIWAGRSGIPQHPIELHELMANIAAWGFVVLLAWRIFLTPDKRRQMKIYVGIGLFWYVLLAITGYFGGQLVFEYGAGVAGPGRGESALTLSDLNVLATRQTDLNLRYSEWMHHVFGWMTLGLAASLLAQALWPKQAPRLKWIVPGFLLAGGIFLFFMADRDLYALADLRQWRDREVQLHKTLAIIMGTIGAAGLWRLAKKNVDAKQAAVMAARGSNSKLVAVLALIGGAMLFTHVHTVAPYANVAAGVYIAHVVLGLIALSIGATRLLQDYFPAKKQALALLFGGLMAIESVLLITYNEGLPWYIGYGVYDRWGPDHQPDDHQSLFTVAPFGDFRALLNIDPISGNVHVVFRNRQGKPLPDVSTAHSDEPLVLTLEESPQLIITRGYQETAISLTRSRAENEIVPPGKELIGSNFRGRAEFLKTAPFVSARLVLKRNGRREVGYFDPWVTPNIIAVPPNEVAKYACPMHEGFRSLEPGHCGICGMELLPIRPPLPPGELHDAAYGLRISVDEKIAATMKPMATRLVLKPTVGGQIENEKAAAGKSVSLAVVHEQLIHVVIVSEDLAYFDHVHPYQSPGDDGPNVPFFLDYQFPRAGHYILFADYTPTGDWAQIFRMPFEVTDKGVRVPQDREEKELRLPIDEARGSLVASISAGKTPQDSAALDKRASGAHDPSISDVQVDLITQPRTLYAGLHENLVFRLAEAGGQPVVNLKPYLGAMGHCVIISEDTSEYIHAHPSAFILPKAGDRGGPEVVFQTLFPKPGRYRIWGQFKRPPTVAGEGDRLVIADFTVEVKSPWVPAGIVRFLLGD